ncbi:MAG: DUF5678 domain-containing protein [Gemmataceae bacterium]|nr:DUF5678 domain-containing protein [Gemmataceae bacterium]
MMTSTTKSYQDNRDQFSAEELRKYEGQWVAFSVDGSRVLTSAATIAEVASQLQANQIQLQNAVLEHIELDSTEISLGAAEL